MLWMLLFVALFAGAAAGTLYLAGRVRKFQFIEKLSKGSKKKGFFLGLLLIAAVIAVLWKLWGSMNAVICVLHLMVFWACSDGIFGLIRRFSGKTFKRYYAGAFAILFTAGYLAVGWYQAHHVWEKDYTIETDKSVGDLRVVMFADSHVGTTFHGEGFAQHMKEIQDLNPDVVLIAGDYVDDDSSKEDMIRCCQALRELKTTYGVYFSFGNHDKGYYDPDYRGYDGDDLIAELEKKDRSEEMKAGRGNGRASMAELTNDLDPEKFSIVIDHQPADYAAQAEAGVDLVLSGHTHGGQLFPLMNIENLTGMTSDDRVYGYEKRDNTNFIVTSGISDWAIKFKTRCRSEYVVADIKGM